MPRVLVIDDDASIRYTLDAVLSDAGMEVEGCPGGREGLEAFEARSADVVLTDLAMPEVDGLAVLAGVRALDPAVPVLILTAHGSERVAVAAMKAGAFEYLPKPFDPEELVLAVRRGIETHDWSGWAELFTEDALYEEHNLGVFNGRAAIQKWIVECMADYPTMTLWIEWYMIEGNRISFYIWNNLPDPTGTGKRFGFPNTTILEYAGDGKFSFEGDYYNPEDAGRVFVDWIKRHSRII
jgi:CheY-like chemotaxis protein